MRKYLYSIAVSVAIMTVGTAQEIQWMTFEEAMEANANGDKRPIFIDVYTDWCGWCKKMDASTFSDPEVAEYMNKHFLNVKLDGEYRDSIRFRDKSYKYVASGRRGYHELAAALLQNRLSYPTVVFLDGDFNMLSPVPGYQPAPQFLNIAQYFGSGVYLTTTWEDYSAPKAE